MAVYTPVSDQDLSDFLQNYDIGEVISLTEITEGVENSNFILKTSLDSYILTLYEKRVSADDLPFFMKLISELYNRDISCPKPIKNKHGDIINKCAGKYATIVSFLNGETAQFTNLERCSQIGVMLARLHLAGAMIPLSRDNPLGPASWLAILKDTDDSNTDLATTLNREAITQINHIISSWPTSLPSGVIHGDLFPNNAMFIGDALTGIIDFYFACTGFFAYDLAICLNSWCFESDGRFNSEKATRLISSYQTIRKLTQDEIDALPILSQGAAARFFATRYYDWHHTPKDAHVQRHDPLEYWNKITFLKSNANLGLYGF